MWSPGESLTIFSSWMYSRWQLTLCYHSFGLGNQLQMGSQVCLPGKKKLARKRITGFQVTICFQFYFTRRTRAYYVLKNWCTNFMQYCPSDSSKVMVTSADSQVRILCRSNIICKFKGVSETFDVNSFWRQAGWLPVRM